MGYESNITYVVWNRLIHDEELCERVFAEGEFSPAPNEDLSEEEVATLLSFREKPGTVWALENLRFRTALETGAALSIHLPRTICLLTHGDENWLQDICFAYMVHCKWDSLGHYRLAESKRFADYVRNKLIKQRATPVALLHVLELEMAVVEAYRRTSELSVDDWPVPPTLSDDELEQCTPKWASTTLLVHQPVDLRPVWEAKPPQLPPAVPGETNWLLNISTRESGHRIRVVGEGIAVILNSCTGDRKVGEIVKSLDDEYDLPPGKVRKMIAGWLAEGLLTI